MNEVDKPHIPLFYTENSEVILHDHDKEKQSEQKKQQLQQQFSDEYFEIETSIETIKKFSFKRVALQLPDYLLWAARTIVQKIESKCSEQQCKVFILGDTSYGSCCVDEVNASHLKADFIIHYGHSCLSPATKLPVQYVFGRKTFDENEFLNNYKNQFKSDDKVLVFYGLEYAYTVKTHISSKLKEYQNQSVIITDIDNFNNIYYSQSFLKKPTTDSSSSSNCCSDNSSCCNDNKPEQQCSDNNSTSCCSTDKKINNNIDHIIPSNSIDKDLVFGRKLSINIEDIEQYKILWIGEECLTLTNLLMNFNKNSFYRFNNENSTIQQVTLTRNQSLMKRYVISNKCKEANIIGIVVATLTVQKYSETIDSLKKLILKSGKKPYVFVVGRLNVPKLANFSEIDIFVIVACPENTVIDSKEYYKPIATPFELNMALRGEEWSGEYITDFGKLFPRLIDSDEDATNEDGTTEKERAEDDVSDEEGNRYHFSLTTGKIVKYYTNTKQQQQATTTTDANGEIIVVDNKFKQLTTATNASEYFTNRTYRGLETKIGETEVTKAIIGKSGIPKSYDNDIGNNQQ